MSLIRLNENDVTKVDEDVFHKTNGLKIQAHFPNKNNVYACIRHDDGTRTYLHRWIMKAPLGLEVDHINGNTLDNRRENLRICTRNENMKNTKKKKSLEE